MIVVQFSFAVFQFCDVQRDGQSDFNRCCARMATRWRKSERSV